MPAFPAETQDSLPDAYSTLKSSREAPGKKEQALDNLDNTLHRTQRLNYYFPSIFAGNTITTATQLLVVSFLDNFFDANRPTLSAATAGTTSLESKSLGDAISEFGESVKVLLNGLDGLAHVHAFIGGTPEFLYSYMCIFTHKRISSRCHVQACRDT